MTSISLSGWFRQQVYPYVYFSAILPITERFYRRPTLKWLKEAEVRQYWSVEDLRSYQFKQVREISIHASRSVAFYRDFYHRLAFNPIKLAYSDDVAQIPLIDKQEVKKDPARFVADGIDVAMLSVVKTGGSTGIPMQFWRGGATIAAQKIGMLRALKWYGVQPGEPRVEFWGHSASFDPTKSKVYLRASKRVRATFNNRLEFQPMT